MDNCGGKKSCKYYKACGNTENCKRCAGYDVIVKKAVKAVKTMKGSGNQRKRGGISVSV